MRCCDQHCCTFAVHKTVEGKASDVEGEASAGPEVAEPKLLTRRPLGLIARLARRFTRASREVAQQRVVRIHEVRSRAVALKFSDCDWIPVGRERVDANSHNQTATRADRQTDCQDAQQPVRTACCARWGRRAAACIVQGAGGEQGGERSRSDGAALKSTGSRRPTHRSASPARAASRQRATCQLQPAAAPVLGRYLRHLNRPQSLYSLCPGNKNSSRVQ